MELRVHATNTIQNSTTTHLYYCFAVWIMGLTSQDCRLISQLIPSSSLAWRNCLHAVLE